MLNLKRMVMTRAKSKPVVFLSPFTEVSFNAHGSCKFAPQEETVKPLEFGLLVPLHTNGTPLYGEALGVSVAWEVKGGKLTIDPESWLAYSEIQGASKKALLSVPRSYQARPMSALLPAEVRKLTSSSADVMGMINSRDPNMVDRISSAIGDRVKAGEKMNDTGLSNAIEAAINVELTMKYPDLLVEIERVQISQTAIQLAVMLGQESEFFVTLQMDITGGAEMINEVMVEIEPPAIPAPKPDEEMVTVPRSALSDALALDDGEDDDEDDDLLEDDEDAAPEIDGPSSVEVLDEEDEDDDEEDDDEEEDDEEEDEDEDDEDEDEE